MEPMTRQERLFAAFRRQPVDRVPFATYNLHPFSAAHRQDASYAQLLDLVWQQAGMLCKTGVTRQAAPAAAAANPHLEVTTETVAGNQRVTSILHAPAGDLRSVTVQPAGQPAMVTEHYIKTDHDIRTYMSLPFAADEFSPDPAAQVDRDLGGRGVAYVGYDDPMHAAAALFDFGDFVVRCATEPGPVVRLIDFQFERIQANLGRQLAACRDRQFLFYTAGPELCTPPMLPPAAFARLVTPYQSRLIRMIHEAGFLASLHCHGRVRDVVGEVVKTGADVLEPIEPPPQGDVTLGELMAGVGGELCLMGYIQDQEFHTAPPGTMRRRVEQIARVVAGRPGYVMVPTCTPFQHPAADTFRRNYAEWLEAAARILG
jgi:hypothetical protein